MNVYTASIQTTVLEFYSFEITSQPPVLFTLQTLEQSYRGDGLGEGMFRMQIKDKCRLVHLELVLPTWLTSGASHCSRLALCQAIFRLRFHYLPPQGQGWERGGGDGGEPEDRTGSRIVSGFKWAETEGQDVVSKYRKPLSRSPGGQDRS